MRTLLKHIYFKQLLLALTVGFAYAGSVFAGTGTDTSSTQNLGSLATNVIGSFTPLGEMIVGLAFLAGIGFVMAAIFKFKQHKDNPTQIPLGTPLAMLVVGVLLIFLPNLVGPTGSTIFGGSPTAGKFTGEGATTIGNTGGSTGTGGGT